LTAADIERLPDSPPPTMVSLLLRLAYSTAALAAATGSREKAIAVGPVNSGASGSNGCPSRRARQPVLGHAIARPGAAHLPPQLRDLGDGQPGLMRHDDANRLGEILVQTLGQLLLLRSIHPTLRPRFSPAPHSPHRAGLAPGGRTAPARGSSPSPADRP
jgi:hypothetical protein